MLAPMVLTLTFPRQLVELAPMVLTQQAARSNKISICIDIFVILSLRNAVREFSNHFIHCQRTLKNVFFGVAILRIDVGHFPTGIPNAGGVNSTPVFYNAILHSFFFVNEARRPPTFGSRSTVSCDQVPHRSSSKTISCILIIL